LLADEVYQDNIYKPEKPFISCKKVMFEMGAPYKDNVELISFHSVSKGVTGDCGLRGGYFEFINIDPFAAEMMLKLKSTSLTPNSVGMLNMGLMVNPPRTGVNSDEVVKQYEEEKKHVFKGLKERAVLLANKLNECPYFSCQDIEGAMYGFPSIKLPSKFVEEAKSKGKAPDLYYCGHLLENTGIMTVPGSGFGQKAGTHHLRITNLIADTKEMENVLN